MALLRTLALKKLFTLQSPAVFNAVRQAGGASPWVEDYMAGDYPKNEEERRAAAEKYGLLPHEYEAYDPDGVQANGDYPNLPDMPAEARDPYHPWDYPVFRKNYNEVWHDDWDKYTEDHYDNRYPFRTAKWKMYTCLISIAALIFGGHYLTQSFPVHRPACQRQLPFRGKVHYSFERGHN